MRRGCEINARLPNGKICWTRPAEKCDLGIVADRSIRNGKEVPGTRTLEGQRCIWPRNRYAAFTHNYWLGMALSSPVGLNVERIDFFSSFCKIITLTSERLELLLDKVDIFAVGLILVELSLVIRIEEAQEVSYLRNKDYFAGFRALSKREEA